MLLTPGCKLSNLRHSVSSIHTKSMPTVFYTKSENTKPSDTGTICFNDYDGSSSDTETEDDDDDTIVRWGWVWYKGEMRRISELPQSDGDEPGVRHKNFGSAVFSLPELSHQKCGKEVDAFVDPPLGTTDDKTCLIRSEQWQQNQSRYNPPLTKEFPSPLPSPVYVKNSPFHQKTRKTTSYRSVYCFDAEDSDSESDGDFDCEQVAAFLVNFLGDDEDDFFDD